MATGYSRGPEKEKGSSPPEAVRGRPTATPKVGGRRKRVSLTKKRRGIRTSHEAALNRLTGRQG